MLACPAGLFCCDMMHAGRTSVQATFTQHTAACLLLMCARERCAGFGDRSPHKCPMRSWCLCRHCAKSLVQVFPNKTKASHPTQSEQLSPHNSNAMCLEAATLPAVTAQACTVAAAAVILLSIARVAGGVIAVSSLTHRRACGAACQEAAAGIRFVQQQRSKRAGLPGAAQQ